MIIKVDTREPDLLQQLNHLTSSVPSFKNIIIKSETLPIGDIIICDETESNHVLEPVEKLIIERKSISDLLASIKDGRYEEQSYRLNGLNHHNHNGELYLPNVIFPYTCQQELLQFPFP